MNSDIAVYAAIFVAVLGQSTFVVSIFAPGLSAVLAATFLATTGQLNLAIIFGVAWTASLLGDNIGFLIGRFGIEKIPVIERHFLKAKPKAARFFKRHRLLPLLYPFLGFTRTPLPIFLGSIGYKRRKWLPLSIFATTLFYSVFIGSCYLLGSMLGRDSARTIIIVAQIIVVTGLLTSLGRFVLHKRQKKRPLTAKRV